MKNSIKPKFSFKYLSLVIGFVLLLGFSFLVIKAFNGNFHFPEQISIGPLALKFYGIIILASVVLSAAVFEKLASKFDKNKLKEIEKFDMYEALIWVVLPGVAFARLVYYLTFLNTYYHGSFDDIYKIWEGGLSIFGAILGGIVGLILYLKKSKIKLFPILDLIFIVIPLGHAIGRWANFINQEIYGPPTNLPWKMYVDSRHRANLPIEAQHESFFHPLFLYEFFLNLILFGILVFLFKKNKNRFNGFFISIYLVGYGLIRFVMEFPRYDPAEIFGLSVAQIISLVMVICGGGFLIYKLAKKNGKS